jgi:hypothetical protein
VLSKLRLDAQLDGDCCLGHPRCFPREREMMAVSMAFVRMNSPDDRRLPAR